MSSDAQLERALQFAEGLTNGAAPSARTDMRAGDVALICRELRAARAKRAVWRELAVDMGCYAEAAMGGDPKWVELEDRMQAALEGQTDGE